MRRDEPQDDSSLIRHEPCPECGSRDNLARYSDGHGYCFGCGHWEPGDNTQQRRRHSVSEDAKDLNFERGEIRALEKRGLTKETCEKWNYTVGDSCQIANYRDATGQLVGQKIRRAGKDFSVIGKLPLYGMWLWSGGKSVVITEGEIDALSMSQAFGNKWPVVSIPNGAQGAAKAIRKHYEWLDQFERIVLMFDQDEPGREAAEECAALLPVGKAFVAVLGRKDPNEVLLADGEAALVKAFWNARPWRPDGIVSGEEFTLDQLKQAVSAGYPVPYPELQNMVLGIRKGELTLLTAGSGIGKSTWARELAYHLHQNFELSIGNVFLEENNAKTAQGYVALHYNVPLGRLRHSPDSLSDEQWQTALEKVVRQRMWFYNHFGSLDASHLLTKLRYMAMVCGVDFIILDHISIVTSGVESSSEGERKDIDILMTRLRSLAEETGVGIIAIVHLKRAQNKVFNEGSQVSLSDLRGSGSLEQLSDNVFALERDQQSGDRRDLSTIRVLKCRETGDTGEADTLNYNRTTGRLEVAKVTVEEAEDNGDMEL